MVDLWQAIIPDPARIGVPLGETTWAFTIVADEIGLAVSQVVSVAKKTDEPIPGS